MEIRPEHPGDFDAIRAVTTAAFQSAEHSSGTEGAIIDALRDAGALDLSLVALVDDELVGHVAFSPIAINGEDRGWAGLGPVSVLPDWQKQGIGDALIRTGLERLKADGARGCVVLGSPGYYRRFGFEHDVRLQLDGVPPEFFLQLTFAGETPAGTVAYHLAFDTR